MKRIAAICATAFVAACAQTQPVSAKITSCDAQSLLKYIGTQFLSKEQPERPGHLHEGSIKIPYRVLKPMSAATMDYRPDRLNVQITNNGIITGFKCV